MNCDRCYQPIDTPDDHGLYLCPLEPRSANSVIGDDIPGGVLIYHGICHPDGTPKRYYSKSAMAKEAKALGLINMVRHVPDPVSGSDKAKNTSRWI